MGLDPYLTARFGERVRMRGSVCGRKGEASLEKAHDTDGDEVPDSPRISNL